MGTLGDALSVWCGELWWVVYSMAQDQGQRSQFMYVLMLSSISLSN